MNKNELNLPVNNELYVEEEIDVTKSNENKTVDDPRRGAKTLESEWIFPDNISICSENASIESRGSEVTREEEIFWEIHAQHDLHRIIDTETILLHLETQERRMRLINPLM